jgi:type VI secretion system protein ImpL
VVQLRSLSQAAQDLYILAAPDSPMRHLLASMSRQLTLSVPAEGTKPPSAPTAAPSSTELRLQALLGASQSPNAPPPGHEIDERYAALRALVARGAAAPIEQLLREIGDAQQQIAKLAASALSTGATSSTAGIDPLLVLKSEAARQPQPLGRWLTEIATGAIALRSGDPRQQLAAIFNAPGGPAEICPAVVNGHYPFVSGATDEVSIADFARLFAPGAALDAFLNTLLRRYVDTSGKTWRLLAADAASSPISPGDLQMFQRAAAIRDAFFPDDGTHPRFRLDITPVSADAGTRQVRLEVDGTSVALNRGAQRATQVTWPGFSLQPSAEVEFEPPARGVELRETGVWALFRLFSRGKLQAQPGSGDRYTLTFQAGERQAVFEVRVPGAANPLAPNLLQDFRCPGLRAN